MPSFMDRLYGAYLGFREPAMFANPTGGGARGIHGGGFAGGWGDFRSRQLRYEVLWAFYEQNAYRDVQGWPQQLRATYGLYEGVRDLFGIAHQLGEFWAAHLQGGHLDLEAGDGQSAPSALPIVMAKENPAVREGLGELLKRSNWAIQKDVAARFGVTTGDVFLEIRADNESETVRLGVVPAGRVKWADLTTEGDVAACELEYLRPDPRHKASDESINGPRTPYVRYNEIVTPDPSGKGYRWSTYLDGIAFTWPGNPGPTWTVGDLPFCPLVKVQHINIGLGWGQAEAMAALSGMREIADLSSCLTDWARKACNAPHLMTGMANPASDPAAVARAAAQPATAAQLRSGIGGEFAGAGFGGLNQSRAEAPSRSANNYLYVQDVDAKAHPLVLPVPVEGLGHQIDRLKAKNDSDYPELSFERIRASGQASAEAIREARKPAEAKIHARRVEYDNASVRAFRMALTLGGLRGYRHYEPFNAGSYDDGKLDFRIGDRPAFAPDPMEKIAERMARYQAMQSATAAGLPLDLAMEEAGYSKQDIARAVQAKADAQQHALAMASTAPKPPTLPVTPITLESGASA